MLNYEFIKNEMEIIINGYGSQRAKRARVLLSETLFEEIQSVDAEIKKLEETLLEGLTEEEKEKVDLYTIYESELDYAHIAIENASSIKEKEAMVIYTQTLKEDLEKLRESSAIKKVIWNKRNINAKKEYKKDLQEFLKQLESI